MVQKNHNVIETYIILVVFFFILIHTLYQHNYGLSWDFSVYALNGDALFGHGHYFEWLRPPLASFFLGLWRFFFGSYGNYVYIFLVTLLHFISCKRLCKHFQIDFLSFYVFSSSTFFLTESFLNGSELLSLTMLQFALSATRSYETGFFLGLGILSRYTNGYFLLLIFLLKKRQNWVKECLTAGLVVFPWLVYNKIYTGSLWTSIANIYANNVVFRKAISQPIRLSHFKDLIPVYTPFLLLYLRIFKKNKEHLVFILIALVTLYSFASTPFKNPRYLYNLLLPLSYFSTVAMQRYSQKTTGIVLVLFMFCSSYFFFHSNWPLMMTNPYDLKPVLEYNDNCGIKSNIWPTLSYMGWTSEPYPPKKRIIHYLDQGYRIVLQKNLSEPPYQKNHTFIHSFPIIFENDAYIILGNSALCKKDLNMNRTYLDLRAERLTYDDLIPTDYSPCEILFPQMFCQ